MHRHATIVVPIRNQRPDWLERSLHSALAQTVPVQVLAITAPDSTDQTLRPLRALAAAHPALQVMLRRHSSFAGAINTGFELCETQRVGLLLSDDWLEPNAVEACLPHDRDIVCTGRRIMAADGVTELAHLSQSPTQSRFEALDTLERKASYLEHFFLFRRDAVLEVGGVDPEIGLTGADDYDMIWSMLERGATVQVVSEQLYNMRDHDGERLTLRDAEAQIADLGRILAKHGVPPEERPAIVARHAKWYGRTIAEAAAII